MKKFLSFFTLILLLASVNAQSISIGITDTAQYPTLKTRVSVLNNANPTENDFKVIDYDGTILKFKLVKVNEPTQNKDASIFFLIEQSPYTAGKTLDEIKTGLSEGLTSLGSKYYVNVGTFGKAAANGGFKPLSIEYTKDAPAAGFMVANIANSPDSTKRTSDIFKGIDEALDYIINRKNLPPNRMLFVLGVGLNKSGSPIKADDIIAKAQKNNIAIYSLAYNTGYKYAADNLKRIADQTEGKSKLISSAPDITNLVQDYVEEYNNRVSNRALIELEYETDAPADGKEHTIAIDYQGQRASAIYIAPTSATNFLNLSLYIIIALVVLALVALSVYFAIAQRRKREANNTAQDKRFKDMEEKNQRLQDEIKKRQLTNPGSDLKAKADPKKTIISTATANPVLTVNTTTQGSQKFNLKPTKITIGRAQTNDITIAEQSVSSNHAEIIIENGNYVLVDLNSTNGTFVNGKRITKHPLTNADSIRMGAAELTFTA